MIKAFAVSETPVKRGNAYSPLSSQWTLYRPDVLAEKLEVDLEKVKGALERCGFSKAVRIREEIIRWKERLRKEERDLHQKLASLRKEEEKIKSRLAVTRYALENTRNILRLPRDDNP